jgi:hypothetical protein
MLTVFHKDGVKTYRTEREYQLDKMRRLHEKKNAHHMSVPQDVPRGTIEVEVANDSMFHVEQFNHSVKKKGRRHGNRSIIECRDIS